MWKRAVESLNDSTSERLSTPEGAVGDVDVDSKRLLQLVIQAGPKRGEDTLESLRATAEIETLLAALEEGLLDLRVLLAWGFAHEMVEEVDRIDAVMRVRGTAVQEGLETGEVDLAGKFYENPVLVLAGVVGAALFGV